MSNKEKSGEIKFSQQMVTIKSINTKVSPVVCTGANKGRVTKKPFCFSHFRKYELIVKSYLFS